MSELQVFYSPCGEHTKSYYLKSEADKVLAEKDKALAELKEENECLKIELGAANIHCENLINWERRLKRALWLARAERNKALAAIVHCQGAWYDTLDTKKSGKFWNNGGKLLTASKKCRVYADKFK